MLAKANRVREPGEFRRIVRRGTRTTTKSGLLYIAEARDDVPRFGFIVAKTVGNAVVRNRTRRRLSAIVHEVLHEIDGVDVVIRAFPAAAARTSAELRDEFVPVLRRLQSSRS